MPDSDLPLGKLESLNLEFKSARAMSDLNTISRAVVGMLNGGGGEVWIGIREEGERGVAIEPVPDPTVSARRIVDHLADAVEPHLLQEVRVERVPADDGTAVIRIHVVPRENCRPYAQLQKGGRFYWIRIGARLRPMSREEIQEEFSSTHGSERRAQSVQRNLLDSRSSIQKRGFSGLIGLLEPEVHIPLELPAGDFREYFSDPIRTGNRRGGWNFTNPYIEPQPGQNRMTLGDWDAPRIEVRSGGSIQFTLPREHLQWKGGEQEIWPYVLCEYPVSILRLASTLIREHPPTRCSAVWAELSLHGLEGWSLKPSSPDSIGYRLATGLRLSSEEPVIAGPVCLQLEELRDAPDRCSFRLLSQIYAAFGYYEKDLPHEFLNDENAFLMPSR